MALFKNTIENRTKYLSIYDWKKAVQNPEIVKRAIKSKIQKWSDKEKKFFRKGEHKANSPLRSYIGKPINNTMQNLVPSITEPPPTASKNVIFSALITLAK